MQSINTNASFIPGKTTVVKNIYSRKTRERLGGGGVLNYHGADKIRSPSDTRTGRRLVRDSCLPFTKNLSLLHART